MRFTPFAGLAIRTLTPLFVIVLVSGCATPTYQGEGYVDQSTPSAYCSRQAEIAASQYSDNEALGTGVGALAGGAIGAIIGNQSDRTVEGAAIGAGVGAGTGYLATRQNRKAVYENRYSACMRRQDRYERTRRY